MPYSMKNFFFSRKKNSEMSETTRLYFRERTLCQILCITVELSSLKNDVMLPVNSYLHNNPLFFSSPSPSLPASQIVAVHPHFVRSHFRQFVTGGKKVSGHSVMNFRICLNSF